MVSGFAAREISKRRPEQFVDEHLAYLKQLFAKIVQELYRLCLKNVGASLRNYTNTKWRLRMVDGTMHG